MELDLDQIELLILLGDHPYIMSAKGLGGWGQKMACFLLTVSTIYVDVGWVPGGCVRKNPKMC